MPKLDDLNQQLATCASILALVRRNLELNQQNTRNLEAIVDELTTTLGEIQKSILILEAQNGGN